VAGILRVEIFPRHMFSTDNLFVKKNVFVTIYKNQNYIKFFDTMMRRGVKCVKNMSFAGTFNLFGTTFVKYTYKSIYDLNLSGM